MSDEATRDLRGRWVKGQSANPKGRPKKGFTIADAFRKELQRAVSVDDGGEVIRRIDRIADRMATLAENGDVQAARLLAAYVDGRPPVIIKSGDDDEAKTIAVASMGVDACVGDAD